MCRLYGFVANEPSKVECSLIHAQNALLIQSQRDRRGVSHSDGWGIAYYTDTIPEIERQATAAWKDLHFSAAAERVYAKVVLAHVRRGTVGGISEANSHPFVHLKWAFAHNGTIVGFDKLQSRLEEETDPELLPLRRGSTDSETAFFWVLSRILQSPAGALDECEAMVRAVVSAVSQLGSWCAGADTKRALGLNFMLTNGKSLVASRWGRPLYWVQRKGVHDCEICGIPHIQHADETTYRAVVVASEPITQENWQEVPERQLLAVGRDLTTRMMAI